MFKELELEPELNKESKNSQIKEIEQHCVP